MKKGEKDPRTPYEKWLDRCPRMVLFGPEDGTAITVEVRLDPDAIKRAVEWAVMHCQHGRDAIWPASSMALVTAHRIEDVPIRKDNEQ